MCGFVGIFAYRSTAPPVDAHELRVIREAMTARGPDCAGEWTGSDYRVGLGSRRLAIIDPTPDGDQPMTSPNGRFVVAFNGAIYNHHELRSELERTGRRFVSHCDTEVLLHLYDAEGPAMVEKLRGMFAFAIWDRDQRSLFLARDPYGIKPLYYADNGSTIRVASQVKALLAGGQVSRAIDPAGAAGFYLMGSVPEPFTIRQEIRALPAGSVMLIREASSTHVPMRFFSVAKTYAAALERPLQESKNVNFKDAVLESVRYHLVSDVPVGAFLSSGIDSGAIVGLARQLDADLATITLTFEEYRGSDHDEAPLAESVARLYGASHATRIITRQEFDRDRDPLLQAMDQPTIDGVNTWFVSKAASELGLKVALSGLGGDELLGGYPSFREIPQLTRVARPVSHVPFLPGVFQFAMSRFGRNGKGQKLAGILKYGGTDAGAYFLKRALFLPWELPRLLGPDVAEEGLRRLEIESLIANELNGAPADSFARIASLESSLYMRNQLLRDTDWASMAHSLEVRVPLVDAFLLRQVAPMRLDGSGKARLAMTPAVPLPTEIRERKKTGFTVPLSRWIARSERNESPMRRWARQVFSAATAR
jgi:asparagine synthase (glutamine-hydrolysing)